MGKQSRLKRLRRSSVAQPTASKASGVPDLAQTQAQATNEILTEGRTVAKVVEAGVNLSSFVGNIVKFTGVKLKVLHDCNSGCSWCCHQPVAALIPEVLDIANHLGETRTADEIEALKADLRRQVEALAEVADVRLQRQTCALLADGRCSIYDHRPSACGGYYSTDQSACKRQYDVPADQDYTIPVFGGPMTAEILAGARVALKSHNLASYPVLLSRALLIALEEPNAAQRYLDGEPVFASAKY